MDSPKLYFSETRRDFIYRSVLATGLSIAAPYRLLASTALSSTALPKPQPRGLVFLFQGDSITDGNRGRSNDPNHVTGHGYAFSIASRVGATFLDKKLVFFNRGISGNEVADLSQRWQQDALDLKPDVLSILVGVNDAASFIEHQNAGSAAQYEETYRALLEQTRRAYPNVLFVLGEPFVLPVGRVKEAWAVWQAAIAERQQIVRRIASAHNAVLVPFQQTFDQATQCAPADYWIWDGIHPTVAGHELMAQQWLKQVSHQLSFLKHYNRRL